METKYINIFRAYRCLPRVSNLPRYKINTNNSKIVTPQCRLFSLLNINKLHKYYNNNVPFTDKKYYSEIDIVQVDSNTFEKVCDDTLESLTEYFEELLEESSHLVSSDVTYGDGVMTVKLGEPYGTYVINRQSPNQQIWLSSPTSGPKRYDFVASGSGHWVYKHDGVILHELLQKEIEPIVKRKVDFYKCVHGSK